MAKKKKNKTQEKLNHDIELITHKYGTYYEDGSFKCYDVKEVFIQNP